MPLAHWPLLPGQHGDITQRRHRKLLLLKFARDRIAYRHRLFEATHCFWPGVPNCDETSIHVHRVVKGRGENVGARSLQFVAWHTGQEFNLRKARRGAFREGRHDTAAIEIGTHLHPCLVHVDLNVVRLGIVRRPLKRAHGGHGKTSTCQLAARLSISTLRAHPSDCQPRPHFKRRIVGPRKRYDIDSGAKKVDLRLENTVRWTERSLNT